MFENISDKKINLYVVGGAVLVIALFTAIRIIPFVTANDNKRASQFIGAPLPSAASAIKYADKAGFHGGDYFVSTKIDPSAFREVTSKLGMSNRNDLLTIWPEALTGAPSWWTVSNTNDTNTFFADRPKEFSKVVARYENGTMYFKRHVPKR